LSPSYPPRCRSANPRHGGARLARSGGAPGQIAGRRPQADIAAGDPAALTSPPLISSRHVSGFLPKFQAFPIAVKRMGKPFRHSPNPGVNGTRRQIKFKLGRLLLTAQPSPHRGKVD